MNEVNSLKGGDDNTNVPSTYWNQPSSVVNAPSPVHNSNVEFPRSIPSNSSIPFIAKGPGWYPSLNVPPRKLIGDGLQNPYDNYNSVESIHPTEHGERSIPPLFSPMNPLASGIRHGPIGYNGNCVDNNYAGSSSNPSDFNLANRYFTAPAQRKARNPMRVNFNPMDSMNVRDAVTDDEEDDASVSEVTASRRGRGSILTHYGSGLRQGSLRERRRVSYADMQETWSTDEEERIIDEERKRRDDERCIEAGIDRVLRMKLDHNGVQLFFIKWLRKAHVHNSWHTYEELRGFHGLKKVDNYMKKLKDFEFRKRGMTPDEIENEKIIGELQDQLDEEALLCERVIAHQGDPTSANSMYLVKWRGCPYEQSTWESREVMQKIGMESHITSYFMREERTFGMTAATKVWNDQPLKPGFTPYETTPPFLRTTSDRELRDYQLVGMNWIISRYKRGLSVLLADEMGLGKTIQAISIIAYMIEVENVIGPFLIVVPQSVLDNWLKEFSSWVPSINVICYHGNAKSREIIRNHELVRGYVNGRGRRYRFDVCLTTPSTLLNHNDTDILRHIPWYLMVVDEAHQLKNRQSKRFIELMQFDALYKLLLSGTPLHNNLEELWSLLHFLNPRLYPSYEYFKYKYPDIENINAIGENKAHQLQLLQGELHEIILRRVKRDVEKSLPNKIERILRVELSPIQLEWYRNVITRNYEQLAKYTGGAKSSLQNICMELKKICNHPYLSNWPEKKSEFNAGLLLSSGKLCLLDQLLARLKAKGHRVLIFSQMVRMLDILSNYLTMKGYKHQRLDGTMGKEFRRKAMDQFNSPDSNDFCFLLSTKAGGLGINLTSADTVIIYDSDWNPQNDIQAEARAHRIGQTKTVQIYRLITKDSIEQNILERAKSKMVLDTLVVQGLNQKGSNGNANGIWKSSYTSSFTREELSRILKFGASKLWKPETEAANPHSLEEHNAQIDVDLDKVLEEAEVTTTDLSGPADNLLSSYNNITEFKYEQNDDVVHGNDKDFWESVIPLKERLKMQRNKADELVITGPRKTRAKEGYAIDRFKDLDEIGEDSDGEIKAVKKKRGRKSGSSLNRTKSELSTSDQFTFSLYRAMMIYGKPSIRISDIADEVGCDDHEIIYTKGQEIISFCEESVVNSDKNSSGKIRPTRSAKMASSNYYQYDTDVEECGGIFGSVTNKSVLVTFDGVSIDASALLERIAQLEAINSEILNQNADILEPWRLPTGPDDRCPRRNDCVGGSEILKFELPDVVTSKFKLWTGRKTKSLWTNEKDVNLLKGVYVYGFGKWEKCIADKNLDLSQLKETKYDKIRIRANKTLKQLLDYEESQKKSQRTKRYTNRKNLKNTTPANILSPSLRAKARALVRPAKRSLRHLKRLYSINPLPKEEVNQIISAIQKSFDSRYNKYNLEERDLILDEAWKYTASVAGVPLSQLKSVADLDSKNSNYSQNIITTDLPIPEDLSQTEPTTNSGHPGESVAPTNGISEEEGFLE